MIDEVKDPMQETPMGEGMPPAEGGEAPAADMPAEGGDQAPEGGAAEGGESGEAPAEPAAPQG